MPKTTNLDKVKNVAMTFLSMPIEDTEMSPIIIQHPIFESGFQSIIVNGEFKITNITEDKDGLRQVTNTLRKQIECATDLLGVFIVIRNSYKLVFLKYIKQYLSKSDFSKLLADAWVLSENPNDDANVSVRTLASWFKHADKKALMTEEDYEVYKSLPDTITVYRGITPGHNPKGLSWTQNIDTARWFANRYDNEGYIQKAVIDKSRALAYLNTRNEDELVVDTRGLKFEVITDGD